MKKDRQTIAFAFKKSLPVMVGYLFLGSAFGIMLFQAGYNFIWAFFISIFVYAGSMQFMLVSFLSAGTAIPTAAAVTLFVNSRHMFYGLSFIEKFKSMGKRFFYMIHSLTDETYTVFCGMKCPKNTDEKKVYFYVALFNHCYWILGGIIGSLMGQYIPFDFKGVDFSMTNGFSETLELKVCAESPEGAIVPYESTVEVPFESSVLLTAELFSPPVWPMRMLLAQ